MLEKRSQADAGSHVFGCHHECCHNGPQLTLGYVCYNISTVYFCILPSVASLGCVLFTEIYIWTICLWAD